MADDAVPFETTEMSEKEAGKPANLSDGERETSLENTLGAVEKILQLRESLNELIENGLLELARARYATGNKSVSTLQLNMGNVDALRTVRSHFEVPGQRYPSFELIGAESGEPQNTDEVEGGVRQRLPAKSQTAGEETQSSVPKHPTPNDPLRWFGVLVPQSLRRSQKCFINALEVIMDVANEQSRFAAEMDVYRASQETTASCAAEP
uniref:Vacuolar ATPase assembly protein VMA22 n=1 Tax=Amblyomma maculatum TaxID=34609 RepID=G3MQH1_AMBMU